MNTHQYTQVVSPHLETLATQSQKRGGVMFELVIKTHIHGVRYRIMIANPWTGMPPIRASELSFREFFSGDCGELKVRDGNIGTLEFWAQNGTLLKCVHGESVAVTLT